MSNEDVYLENERLVTFTMKRDFPQYLGDEDAMQEGRIGLWRAVTSYDPSKGYSLSTLAVPSIHNHIAMYIKYMKKLSALNTVSLYDPASADEDAKEVVEQIPYYEDLDWHVDFSRFFESLSKSSQNMISMRAKGYTDEEVSAEAGVTREAIRQKRKKVYEMYKRFKKEGVVR